MLIECGCMNVLHSRGVLCEAALYHILLGNEPLKDGGKLSVTTATKSDVLLDANMIYL